MYGTRRASRLFQEHMKGVLKEAGYAALKVCHQVYHCFETDPMAAIGDDIIAEGEPEKLDRLDEVLKQLVVVKVLDRVGPRAAEHGQYLKRQTHRAHQRSGIRVVGRSEASCCDHQKPFQGGREATELTG